MLKHIYNIITHKVCVSEKIYDVMNEIQVSSSGTFYGFLVWENFPDNFRM